MRYRAMIKNQEPTAAVEAQGNRVQGLLAEAATLLAGHDCRLELSSSVPL